MVGALVVLSESQRQHNEWLVVWHVFSATSFPAVSDTLPNLTCEVLPRAALPPTLNKIEKVRNFAKRPKHQILETMLPRGGTEENVCLFLREVWCVPCSEGSLHRPAALLCLRAAERAHKRPAAGEQLILPCST